MVHVFLSRGRFSLQEDIRDYIDQRWSENGDAEPSAFMGEAGITEFSPMCIEVIRAQDMGHPAPVPPAVLLREASYADQWLSQVESAELADAAICVFAPNIVTNPHGTSLRYLGQFAIRG
ncbi:hypothetical protein UK12_29320 [Saccharothrix sp. ST-888]|nr:hypothetical protein UK12_29320 [Saccharothrix sp. ST-888]